jgi:hypothetical protein
MDLISAIAVHLLIEFLAGWPLLFAASVATGAILRVCMHTTWSRVFYAIGLGWCFSLTLGLVIWRFWPAHFGGPMWAEYLLGPMTIATPVAFALSAWWAAFTMRRDMSPSTN